MKGVGCDSILTQVSSDLTYIKILFLCAGRIACFREIHLKDDSQSLPTTSKLIDKELLVWYSVKTIKERN
jgi:hypothetical protein